MSYPDYLEDNPRIIFFTDFDGTITQEDCIDWLVETEGYGPQKLKQSCQDILDGKITYREGSLEQMESIKAPLDQCIEKVLNHIKLDDFFIPFYEWAASVSMPIVVLSGGVTPLIRALLSKMVGSDIDGIEVVANEVMTRDSSSVTNNEGIWSVKFKDDSIWGNDKAAAINPYARYRDQVPDSTRPILLFAGDGVIDLGVGRETELLFAKEKQGAQQPEAHTSCGPAADLSSEQIL